MELNRRRDAAINWLVGAALGLLVARWRGHDSPARTAVVVGTVVGAINWLGYEKPAVLESAEP